MAFNLSTFRAKVASVARSQYFSINIPQIGDSETLTALARSTALPAMQHETLPVAYRGLTMKIDDKPTFPDWDVTFLLDEAHSVRNVLLKWQELSYNVNELVNPGHNEYKVDGLSVSQLSSQGETTATATFYGIWPTNIGQVEFNQDGGQLQQFTCTFTYDYYLMNNLQGNVDLNDTQFIDVNSANGQMNGAGVEGTQGVKFDL